ncbi:MAG: 50S ribosomal protein L29 [Chlamydiota bacterium]
MNLREKTEEELSKLALELDGEIFALRNELKLHRKLEKPHLLKEKKRMKARILTILGEKK